MASYNRVILVGNLTRDPEYKQLASGQAVCKIGLATNRQFKNRHTGSLVQEVCYIDIDVWGAQAESCRQYLQKGRAVLIEGRLKFDTWEDQNGQTRSKHCVVADRVTFLSTQSDAENGETNNVSVQGAVQGNKPQEPQSDLEKELLDQIEQIKGRAKETKKAPQKKVAAPIQKEENKSVTGEIDFKDEPPFEDDLPF